MEYGCFPAAESLSTPNRSELALYLPYPTSDRLYLLATCCIGSAKFPGRSSLDRIATSNRGEPTGKKEGRQPDHISESQIYTQRSAVVRVSLCVAFVEARRVDHEWR
jgi:hypothetical protein